MTPPILPTTHTLRLEQPPPPAEPKVRIVPIQVKMAFQWPEILRTVEDEETGKIVVERIPGHAVRPAREYEQNTWWEDLATTSCQCFPGNDDGSKLILREEPTHV